MAITNAQLEFQTIFLEISSFVLSKLKIQTAIQNF